MSHKASKLPFLLVALVAMLLVSVGVAAQSQRDRQAVDA